MHRTGACWEAVTRGGSWAKLLTNFLLSNPGLTVPRLRGAARETLLGSATHSSDKYPTREEAKVSTELGSRPPAIRVRDERPEWVELIRLRTRSEISRLVGRLMHAGIESRLRLSTAHRRGRPLRAVLVPRPELEDARFVLAQIAFESPGVGERDLRFDPLFRWASVALTAVVLSASLLAGSGTPATDAKLPACSVGAGVAAGSCR
jgi:hypothetical protein